MSNLFYEETVSGCTLTNCDGEVLVLNVAQEQAYWSWHQKTPDDAGSETVQAGCGAYHEGDGGAFG